MVNAAVPMSRCPEGQKTHQNACRVVDDRLSFTEQADRRIYGIMTQIDDQLEKATFSLRPRGVAAAEIAGWNPLETLASTREVSSDVQVSHQASCQQSIQHLARPASDLSRAGWTVCGRVRRPARRLHRRGRCGSARNTPPRCRGRCPRSHGLNRPAPFAGRRPDGRPGRLAGGIPRQPASGRRRGVGHAHPSCPARQSLVRRLVRAGRPLC